MYPGHGNPMGSMPNPMGGGNAMRGQHHVHHHQQQHHQQQQQHHHHHQAHHHHQGHHHHHHQGLSRQASGGGGQGHTHSRHSSHHERLGSHGEPERRHVVSSSHSNPSLVIGGDIPYMTHPQDTQHGVVMGGGGFVMGTDLHTSPSTSGWFHDQPVMQAQPVMPAVSTPQTEAVPKDSGKSHPLIFDEARCFTNGLTFVCLCSFLF